MKEHGSASGLDPRQPKFEGTAAETPKEQEAEDSRMDHLEKRMEHMEGHLLAKRDGFKPLNEGRGGQVHGKAKDEQRESGMRGPDNQVNRMRKRH